MIEVRPFRGLRYNPELVSAMGGVLCPPYDVIPPQEKAACLARSPYNVVHLELGEGNGGQERYTRAAHTLRDWLGQGVLVRDTQPALYLHDHHFLFQGCWQRRRGVVAAVGLAGGGIMPHEGTLPQPREDRLRLLRATSTQISPIFALYDDPSGEVASLLEAAVPGPPLLEASLNGERHRLWRITHPETVARLGRHLCARPLIIADGHHRFECARAYRQERQAPGAWDFAMMALVATDDPGLVILPVHRLVRGLDQGWLAGLEDRLAAFFEVEAVPVEGMPPEGLVNLLGEGEIGVLGPAPGRLLRLRLRQDASLPPLLPAEGGKLSVNLVHRLVLEGVPEREIAYTHEAAEAVGRLREYQVAFLLSPLSPADVYRVALAGERLPGKSTYFYPKVPTGLVLFPVDGEL